MIESTLIYAFCTRDKMACPSSPLSFNFPFCRNCFISRVKKNESLYLEKLRILFLTYILSINLIVRLYIVRYFYFDISVIYELVILIIFVYIPF